MGLVYVSFLSRFDSFTVVELARQWMLRNLSMYMKYVKQDVSVIFNWFFDSKMDVPTFKFTSLLATSLEREAVVPSDNHSYKAFFLSVSPVDENVNGNQNSIKPHTSREFELVGPCW